MAYVKKLKIGDTTYDIADGRVITLVDNGSKTAGTWVASTAAPAGNITEYKDGQLFYYKVTVAGASTTTLNIDGLGAKTIYRAGTTKLTTQYPVGSYILLAYNSTNTCFRVVNDYDANSDNDKKTASSNTSSKIFLVGATTQSTSGQDTYSHDTVYVDTDGRVNSRMNGGDTVAPVVTTGDATETVVKSISGGSGSFTPTTKYLHKSTASVAPNSHTHNITVSGTTGNNSGSAVKAVTGYASFSGGSGNLTSDATSTNGIKYIEAVSGGSAVSSTTKYMKFSAGTTPKSAATPLHTSTNTGANSGEAVAALTAVKVTADPVIHLTVNNNTAADRVTYVQSVFGGAGALVAYDASTNGSAKTTNGNRIPFITSLSKSGYTPAGSVSLTDGTAPSMGSATTKYLHFSAGTTPKSGATPNTTSTNSGSAGGGTANQNTGSATPTFTGTEVTSGGSTVLTAASVSNGVLTITSASHTHKVTAAGTVSAHTHTYTKPAAHTHTYDKTTSISLTDGTAPSLTSNTTASGGIQYVHAQGTFSAGTTPKASASFTGTNSTAVVTGGTTYYLDHLHTAASATTKYLGAYTSGTAVGATGIASVAPYGHNHTYDKTTSVTLTDGTAPSMNFNTGSSSDTPYISAVSGGSAVSATTKYLHHTHTGASLGTASTANAAPHTHTHSYGDSTVLTSTANSGTAVTAITGLTANTTKADGDITYLESATHSHTGASVSGTASVYKK